MMNQLLIQHHNGDSKSICELPETAGNILHVPLLNGIVWANETELWITYLNGKPSECWLDIGFPIGSLANRGNFIWIESEEKIRLVINTQDGTSREWSGKRAEQTMAIMRRKKGVASGCGIDVDRENNVLLACPGRNKILIFRNNSTVESLMGCGESGFSVSISPENYLMKNPQGISVDDQHFYVADTGNHCIRIVGRNGVPVGLIGHPQKPNLLGSPTTILKFAGGLAILDKPAIKFWKDHQLSVLVEQATTITTDGKSLYYLTSHAK